MKTKRLRELPDWPPQPGGAYDASTRFPIAGEAVITEVFPVTGMEVTFHGKFEGHQHSYHYFAESEKIAARIREAVFANVGRTVSDLGELEIEVEK
jgi:hypothetical protein